MQMWSIAVEKQWNWKHTWRGRLVLVLLYNYNTLWDSFNHQERHHRPFQFWVWLANIFFITYNHSNTNVHTHYFQHPFILLTLTIAVCLYILVVVTILTIILTFISQMHVKGSQRIRFRCLRGTQRAANEIRTAKVRLGNLRLETEV